MSDVMTRSIFFGALLLALAGATTIVPGAPQGSSTAETPASKAAASAPSSASASNSASAPNVQILPASLSPGPMDDGIAKIPLVAINQGSERARVWFKAYVFDANGNSIPLGINGLWRESKDWIEPLEVVPFTLTLWSSDRPFGRWRDSRLPLKGHLAIETTLEPGPKIKVKKIEMRELSVPQIQPAALEVAGVLGTALGSALVLLIAVWFGAGTAPEGSAAWSADSIGANVTLGAGLVSALFAVAGLPQLTAYASRPTYGFLIAIFTAVVALASPVANLLGKILPAAVSLFAAATLVLWGAAGQFIVAFILVLELYQASVIAKSTAWTLGLLDAGLAIGVVAYVIHAVTHPETRTVQSPPAAAAAQGAQAPQPATVKTWAIP